MKIKYLLFCDRADHTDTQKAVIHGVIDSVLLSEEPTSVKPRGIASVGIAYEVIELDTEEENEVDLKILDPDGEAILEHKAKVSRKKEGKVVEKISGYGNVALRFKKLGNYKMVLSVDGENLGETGLSVRLNDLK